MALWPNPEPSSSTSAAQKEPEAAGAPPATHPARRRRRRRGPDASVGSLFDVTRSPAARWKCDPRAALKWI